MDQTWTWFSSKLAEQGISLTGEQLNQFERYYELLVEWNERMNLTGTTEREAVYEKHFYDSVSLSFYVDMNKVGNIADIGSGAGFPSLPIKICFPHLKVTIVDSLSKRIAFLQHVVTELGLQDVTCLHGRAEDIARLPEQRDQYDLVTARAVAKLNVLNEFCLPFVRKGGTFAAMKGGDPSDEIREAATSMRELRAKPVSVEAMQLPWEQSERHIILLQKTDQTPKKYPRKAGTPLKQPIV
jgi:16S rRNA (guanine527-N7)-methyltransferase